MLDLFEKVEVKKTDRLSKEDLEAIKEIQNRFDNDKMIFNRLNNHISQFELLLTTESFGFETLQKELRDKLKKSTETFIHQIYNHFRYKYQVKLNDTLWSEDKFRWNVYSRSVVWEQSLEYVNSLNYDLIIDDINSQLGTLNFIDKGKQEFLDQVKKDLGYKMIHKNNKVSYNSLVYQDTWNDNNINYNSTGNMKSMLKSINLFENDSYDLSSWACNFVDECKSGRSPNFEAFKTHTNIPYGEIEHIKIFKNGKVELKFEDYETAKKYYDMFFKESRY